MSKLLVEVECEKCKNVLYVHAASDAEHFETPGPHMVPIVVEGIESGFTICKGAFKKVQVWQPQLPDRLVGNRFVIRNGELIKISNGERIPEEEPLFLFRGRDHLAFPTLNLDYRTRCFNDGCNDYIMNLLDESVEQFKKFAHKFPERMKQPGVTRGK